MKTELINKHVPWPLIPVPTGYVLLEYAEKDKTDLNVVGTKGQSAFRNYYLEASHPEL
jgi:hypothetical protein